MEPSNDWGAPVVDKGPRMLGPGADKPTSFNAGPKMMGPGAGKSDWDSGPKMSGPGVGRNSVGSESEYIPIVPVSRRNNSGS